MDRRTAFLFGLVLSASAAAQVPFAILNEPIAPDFPGSDGFSLAADFDLDFDLDLLGSTSIGVNDGNARFATGPGNPFGISLIGLAADNLAAAGDLNGDGLPDVLSGGGTGNDVLLNDGALGFVPGPPTPISGGLYAGHGGVALADVDGDGDLDACFARVSWTVFMMYAWVPVPSQPLLWLNDGTGTFTDATAARMPAITPLVNQVDMRDFDGDGDVDIFLWRSTPQGTPTPPNPAWPHLLLLNGGGGFFTTVVAVPGPGQSALATVGDFNGDGLPDMAYSSIPWGPAPATDGVTLNTGGGTFAPYVPTTQTTFAAVAAGDFDGNGTDELVRIGNPVTIHTVSPSGVINAPSQTFPVHGAVAYGSFFKLPFGIAKDFDGDGDRDLVVSSGDGRGFVFLNTGTGTLVPILGHLTGPPASYYGEEDVVGDVDGDGDLDYVYRPNFVYPGAPEIAVARNDGAGNLVDDPTFCNAGCPALGQGYRAFPLDFDADGKLDLYVGGATDAVLQNTGAGWVKVASMSLPGFASSVVEGDLDGDGDRDLVVGRRNSFGPTTSFVVFNRGAAGFSAPIALGPPRATFEVVLFDTDLDGDLDIAEANHAIGWGSDPVALFLNNGSGAFTLAPSAFPPVGSYSMVAGDMDQDGDTDLIADGIGFVSLGNGTFFQIPALTNFPLALVDVDDDGDLDLISRAQNGQGALTLIPNTGLGVLGLPQPMPGTFNASVLPHGDLDGDGDQDLIARGRVYTNTTRQLARGSLARPGRVASLDLFGPPGAPYLLFASPNGASIPVPPWGTVFLAPAAAQLAVSGVFGPGGQTTLTGAVPNVPGLVGLTLWWQAALPAQMRLTNLQVITVLGV